jgi:hypothetical protein
MKDLNLKPLSSLMSLNLAHMSSVMSEAPPMGRRALKT